MAASQLPHPSGLGFEQLHQCQGPQVLGLAHSRCGGVRAEDPAHQDVRRRLLRVSSGWGHHHLQNHQT